MNSPAIPGIATMLRPTSLDFRRGAIAQVHHAREMLWIAEKSALDRLDGSANQALEATDSAILMLGAVRTLVLETDSDPEDEDRMLALLERAYAAAHSARWNVERWKSYANKNRGTKLEADMLRKQQPIWRRSTEEAKKEAHRLLMLLCERWPESYEKEDVS